MNDANLETDVLSDWFANYYAQPRIWLLRPALGEVKAPWMIVTKGQWIRAERSAGFYPKHGMPKDEPATGSFASSNSGSGRYVEIELFSPESYDWDPEFRDVVMAEIERLSNGT